MMTRRIVCMAAFLALFPVLFQEAWAAPLPPMRVVNHQTLECGELPYGGDECMDCFPPEGWEVLGVAYDVECPPDYTVVDEVSYDCQPFKNQFCCSEGHSGASGDCEDLVVNNRKKECAFVDDIEDCELPVRWETPRQQLCPSGYDWIDSLGCTAGTSEGDSTSRDSLPCVGAMVLAPAVLGLWWAGKKRA
jgi:hypothetical protein